uniref:Uncharacterized protein n=1 Tax=Arundo donax TaxID=35708 RepID=A0A0A9HCA4_ARUDO
MGIFFTETTKKRNCRILYDESPCILGQVISWMETTTNYTEGTSMV